MDKFGNGESNTLNFPITKITQEEEDWNGNIIKKQVRNDDAMLLLD